MNHANEAAQGAAADRDVGMHAEVIQRLLSIGGDMSNVMFNLAQRDNPDRAIFKELCAKWDAAAHDALDLRAALKAQPAPTEAPNYGAAMPYRAVLGICDAYESGIGHGMQRDQHSSGSIYGNPDHGTAYEIGYEEGKGRSTFKPEAPTEAQGGLRERVIAAIEAERVEETGTDGDTAYNSTLDHCIEAVNGLFTPAQIAAQGEDSARLDAECDCDSREWCKHYNRCHRQVCGFPKRGTLPKPV